MGGESAGPRGWALRKSERSVWGSGLWEESNPPLNKTTLLRPGTMVSIKSALVWPFWLLAAAGWILLLAGNAALQQNCSSSSANALNVAGTIGYLGPVDSCHKFYNLTWWCAGGGGGAWRLRLEERSGQCYCSAQEC